MNIAEAELTNLIENIPQEEKNNKKLVIEYLKEDSEYQILLKQAVRNVRSANLKKRMTVIVLVVIIVLGAGHYYLGVMDGQFRSFSNDYVQVVYNGLQKKEVTPISPEGDTYFYNNWWDLKRKKYIRVVKFYGDTGIDDSIKMMEGDEAERDMFVDICTSQQIYHTLQYAESELGITETQGLNGDFKNEAITGDKGLTIRGDSQTETIENIPDMILVQYKNSGYKYFVVGKTLYVDNSGYMMAMLSYSGMSYDDFIKKSAAQQLIMEAIVKDQKFSMREYDYKGDLDEFAGDNGYSDENAFVEKFGKDSVVKAMLVQKAQDYVIEHANIAYK